jgi:hypothetical protein
MPHFAPRLLHFLRSFPLPAALAAGVEAFSPYRQAAIYELLTQFAHRYYASEQPRVAVLGINPSRLGNGRTGIAFTDPTALTEHCGITHNLPRQRPEPSSEFIYKVISELGGPAEFYQHFYLGSIYPLVLMQHGKNYNYYDSPVITNALWADMGFSLSRLVREVGVRTDMVICLGQRNGAFLHRLNNELKLFDNMLVLDHPRYLMQYHRRYLTENVARYVATLGGVARTL